MKEPDVDEQDAQKWDTQERDCERLDAKEQDPKTRAFNLETQLCWVPQDHLGSEHHVQERGVQGQDTQDRYSRVQVFENGPCRNSHYQDKHSQGIAPPSGQSVFCDFQEQFEEMRLKLLARKQLAKDQFAQEWRARGRLARDLLALERLGKRRLQEVRLAYLEQQRLDLEQLAQDQLQDRLGHRRAARRKASRQKVALRCVACPREALPRLSCPAAQRSQNRQASAVSYSRPACAKAGGERPQEGVVEGLHLTAGTVPQTTGLERRPTTVSTEAARRPIAGFLIAGAELPSAESAGTARAGRRKAAILGF